MVPFRFMRSRTAVVLGLLLAAATVSRTSATAGPTFWTVATSAELLRGTSVGVSVGLDGSLTPAPALTNRLTAMPEQVWSLAIDQDGTLWAGTGGDGRVLRLRTGQPAETVFDAPEANVFALAVAAGRVYAATSPDGRVYAIEGGTAREFFNPEESFIWSMALDASNRLYVAAGSPATVYRVTANGASETLVRLTAAHAVSLVLGPDGRMLVSTDSPGRVYRLNDDGRAFALLDTGATEIRGRSIAADGVIHAASVAREGGDGGSAGPVPTVSLPAESPEASAGASAETSQRSVLYQIATSGQWEPVWQTGGVIYDIAQADDGVFVATGPSGHVYHVGRDRQVRLMTGVDAQQVTRLAGSAAGPSAVPAMATATPGRVLVADRAADAPATFTSAVRDTHGLATFGEIRWQASGTVVLHTRSGNTQSPDASWSDWSPAYTRAAGQPVTSPSARFIQWRAVFARANQGAPPQLTSVTIAYLPQNARPRVTSTTVHPPGVVFQRPFANEDGAIAGLDDLAAERRRPPGEAGPPAPTPGRRMFQKGLQTLAWRAEDADGDRLAYALHYRREGETEWVDLRAGLLDTIFVWDTTTVPDGRYIVRVSASDELANPDGRALVGTAESGPIDVDNTPPTLTVSAATTPQGVTLTIRADDAGSPIQKVEYSVAGGTWRLAQAADGLADARSEQFTVVLPAGTDLRRVSIRATDVQQNAVTGSPAGGR
jgi:outer membrane protein assembly factor BamB